MALRYLPCLSATTTRYFPAIFFCLLVLTSLPVLAADNEPEQREQHEQRLLQLRERIAELKIFLEKAIGKKNNLQTQLEKSEREIGRIAHKVKRLQREQRQKIRKLNELKLDEQRHKARLKQHREVLKRQLRAAYAIGRQEYVKLLLNQQDVSSVGRMLTFYNYFGKARVSEINYTENLLQELHALSKVILQKTGELELLRNDYEARIKDLHTKQKSRKQLLSRLTQDIALKGEQLVALQEDEQHLNKLLQELRSIVTDIPADLGDRTPFASLRGKLGWPVATGKIVSRFGTRRNKARLRWNGVVIRASEGQAVRAIHHGRIVFADWLRGFGLMTIIDHGDGFMSLYGYNQGLYKNVGDWVEAGAEIATVGNTGGQEDAGLYFEIRYKGNPANPEKWCKKSGIRRSSR